MAFFTELEPKKILQIAKAILKKKNGAGGLRLPDFRLILQSYSQQKSMVLEQKQKYRSIEQDRKSRNRLMHIWAPYFSQRRQGYTIEKRQSLQKEVLGKLDSYM